jgi:hypothetical protein
MWIVGQSVSRPSAEASTSQKSGFFDIGNEICFHEERGQGSSLSIWATTRFSSSTSLYEVSKPQSNVVRLPVELHNSKFPYPEYSDGQVECHVLSCDRLSRRCDHIMGDLKVKLSLCLTKHHAMKTYWGVEAYLHAFLTQALDGSEWSASSPGSFTPRERAPGNSKVVPVLFFLTEHNAMNVYWGVDV